jgi:predicted nucleotidyltransferase
MTNLEINLSKAKKEALNNIVNDLKQTDNVVAVVLGGSFAVGKATPTSDVDIGIYYSEKNPFNIDDIKSIAKKYAVADPTVTGFYEWGPWVNGGAWIETASGKVDFLYRNVEQVTLTIEAAKRGEWENHFEQQPPYGFTSIIYLGETNSCLQLYDPEEVISKLKEEIMTYPAKLKETIVQQSLWSLEFTIWHAEYFYRKEDIYNLMGCLTRGVKNIVNALFAINELYPMGDKMAIEILEMLIRYR